MRQSKAMAMVLGVAGLGAAGAALSHEMFVKFDDYFLAPDAGHTAVLVNGTFDESDNVIDRDRMRDVRIIGGGVVDHPAPEQWTDVGDASHLRFETGGEGTYVVAVSTLPTILEMTPEEFRNYLAHEGVPDTLVEFDRLPRPERVRERYSKHVRAIFQVGAATGDDWSVELGYPVEIVPLQNPYALEVGDVFRFRVLFEGEPVPDQFFNASHAGFHAHDASGAHTGIYQLRTDADGYGSFEITRPSIWYVSLIHMQGVDEPDVDYESNWATISFQVR